MTDYACVSVGDVLHAAQTQAALADVQPGPLVRHSGFAICTAFIEGKLTRARPDCAECLAACLVHEQRVDDGTARELPAMGEARLVIGAPGAVVVTDATVVVTDATAAEAEFGIGAEATEVATDWATASKAAADLSAIADKLDEALVSTGAVVDRAALSAKAQAAQPTKAGLARSDSSAVAEDMIERLLIETPTARNQAIVDAVRKAGMKASFGRVDKVRERIGMREPAKPSKAPPAPKQACTPECLAGGPPCTPECAAELGLK